MHIRTRFAPCFAKAMLHEELQQRRYATVNELPSSAVQHLSEAHHGGLQAQRLAQLAQRQVSAHAQDLHLNLTQAQLCSTPQ